MAKTSLGICRNKAEVESGVFVCKGHVRFTITDDRQNFSSVATVAKNWIVFLGQDEITQIKIYDWEEYLQYLRRKCGWLVCLKASIGIYNSDLKGYYGVPYGTLKREEVLIRRLKAIVTEGIVDLIKMFYGYNLSSGDAAEATDHAKDNSAIKVAIEFCHAINSFEFLFTNIFAEFEKEGFSYKFVENLEEFILGRYFKDEILPNNVLK